MNVTQAADQCTRQERVGFVATVDQLHAWAQNDAAKDALIARAREIGREMAALNCQGEYGRERCAPLLAELCGLGREAQN